MAWKPKTTDFADVFEGQNPWHSLGKVPAEFAKAKERPLAQLLWHKVMAPDLRRYQLILGPRRVGKTTVMYQTVQHMLTAGVLPNKLWWIRLDHPLLIEWSLGDLLKQVIELTAATAKDPTYVFLDEVTYSRNWALWLKTAYDEQWPLRIVATSSAVSAMKREAAESGVGRWEEQYLAPYLFTEYLDLQSVEIPKFIAKDRFGETIEDAIATGLKMPSLDAERRRFVLTGGFPELLTIKRTRDEVSELLRSQNILKSDAIERAIYKDIPQTSPVQDPVKLERLLYVLAGQIAGIFSPNTVASDLQISAKTIETYTSYLERAFLIFSVPNFSPKEETVQRRGKKIYFLDGAVRNAALLRGVAPLNDPSEMGLLIENMAAAHLVTLARHAGIRLYHWRRNAFEVDLLYDQPDMPLAFEIASSKNHDLAGCKNLIEKHPKYRGNCYLVYANAPITSATIDAHGTLPLDMFLALVGAQTMHIMKQDMLPKAAKLKMIQRSLFDNFD